MRIGVIGLWHLGVVTAAGLAAANHKVVAFDDDLLTVEKLGEGRSPVFEPELDGLIHQGMREGRLRFTNDVAEALSDADVVWITYDTPVDESDDADNNFVLARVEQLFPLLRSGMTVLISSQVRVGTTRQLADAFARLHPEEEVQFAYSPENLQLGRAVAAFECQKRVIVGLASGGRHDVIAELLDGFTGQIEWMSIESAEMTKHALNAFLAMSVTFANEIACLCGRVGANPAEVERGLKSEERIGPRAYLRPGASFAGGTLARDVSALISIGVQVDQPTPLLTAVRSGNQFHKRWPLRALEALLPDLASRTIAVWGLAYKPDTSTLRRSSAVELCTWLADEGVKVRAHDPAVTGLPDSLAQSCVLCDSPLDAIAGASGLVIATEWRDYRTVTADQVVSRMACPNVIDPNRFLEATLGADPRIRYVAVGGRGS